MSLLLFWSSTARIPLRYLWLPGKPEQVLPEGVQSSVSQVRFLGPRHCSVLVGCHLSLGHVFSIAEDTPPSVLVATMTMAMQGPERLPLLNSVLLFMGFPPSSTGVP